MNRPNKRALTRRYLLFSFQESDFLELHICGQYVLDVARTGLGSMEAVDSQGLLLPALGRALGLTPSDADDSATATAL